MVDRPKTQVVGGGVEPQPATRYGDIRDRLFALPHHHGGNGYMLQDLFTVRHELIRRLRPAPASVFEFGALLGYFLVTALDAAPSIGRVGWLDIEVHTGDSNAMCEENVRAFRPDVEVWWHNPLNHDGVPIPGTWDLVQVDGDHTFDGCLHDLRMAAILAPRWVFVDDWTGGFHEGPVQAATRAFLDEQARLGFAWRLDEHVTANGLAVLSR